MATISESALRQIIREELEKILDEGPISDKAPAVPEKLYKGKDVFDPSTHDKPVPGKPNADWRREQSKKRDKAAVAKSQDTHQANKAAGKSTKDMKLPPLPKKGA